MAIEKPKPYNEYDQFGREIGDSKNPTIDAAGEAFDRRAEEQKSKQESAVTAQQKQAQFKARAQSIEQEDDEISNSPANEALSAQERFKKALNLADTAKQALLQEGLSPAWFAVALIIAVLFDGAGIAINFLLPGLGGAITTILITPIGLGILWFIHKISGVEFSRKIKNRFFLTLGIEAIPVLNAFPTLLALVLISKILPAAESVVKEIGGEKVATVVDKIDK